MSERDLSTVHPDEAKRAGWVVDAGSPAAWECVAKAHNDQLGIMKSTKRMRVPGGWLYQVTTEGPNGYAEAVTFVPTRD